MSERNAEPEVVALTVLDVCERAAREIPVDYNDRSDKDVQFMAGCFKNWQSRIKILKEQAAADWTPRFYKMLSSAHSICIEPISYPEKEGVRTEKMKCMACGRWEKRCRYGLNAVGPFNADDFHTGGAQNLMSSWTKFHKDYRNTLRESPDGTLLKDDRGMYSIGETCMKKAEVFYLLNTLLLNETFEAFYRAEGEDLEDDEMCYATDDQAFSLLERFEALHGCAADVKRAAPEWGVDRKLWDRVAETRKTASRGNDDEMARLLRNRAADFVDVCDSDSEDDSPTQPTRPTRTRATVLVESDSSEEEDNLDDFIVDDEEEEREEQEEQEEREEQEEPVVCNTKRSGRKTEKAKKAKKTIRKIRSAAVPRRTSRRIQGRSPDKLEETLGPHEEGVDEGADEEDTTLEPPEPPEAPLRSHSRAPQPNPFQIAQARRAPGVEARLPARRECLAQLAELQVKLIREGRNSDAAVCTSAIMTLQELLSRVEQLAHTV